MTQYLEESTQSSPAPGKMSLNTALVIGTPLLVSILDFVAATILIVTWQFPSLQEWVNLACFHAAATGLWLFGVLIVIAEWAEKSLKFNLNWWRRIVISLVSAGIYLMGITLVIGGFGALIYTNVFM